MRRGQTWWIEYNVVHACYVKNLRLKDQCKRIHTIFYFQRRLTCPTNTKRYIRESKEYLGEYCGLWLKDGTEVHCISLCLSVLCFPFELFVLLLLLVLLVLLVLFMLCQINPSVSTCSSTILKNTQHDFSLVVIIEVFP